MVEKRISYISVTKDSGEPAGTIFYDPDDLGVSRFIATSADGTDLARITNASAEFQVRKTRKRATVPFPTWQAAAEEVFGPGIRLAHA
jgi:hypothetical protein